MKTATGLDKMVQLIQAVGPALMSNAAPQTGSNAHHPGNALSRTNNRPATTSNTPRMDRTLFTFVAVSDGSTSVKPGARPGEFRDEFLLSRWITLGLKISR